jgi:hypothetical protein
MNSRVRKGQDTGIPFPVVIQLKLISEFENIHQF